MKKIREKFGNKRKKIIAILLALVTIINVAVGTLILCDVQVIQSPEMTIKIDFIDINSDEAILQTTLDIKNQNNIDLIIKDLEIETKTSDGSEVFRIQFEGGKIASHKNKTFISTDTIVFDGEIPETLTTEITGIVGFHFLGIIQKTLPIVFHVKTSLRDIIANIAIPILHVKGDFKEITSDGIDFTTEVKVDNPNSFDIQIEDILITVKTEEGELVGDFDMQGGLIAAKSSTTLNGEGKVLIEALNTKTLFINLSTSAGVMIAGITEYIEFSTEMEIAIPQIEDIFSQSLPTEAFIDADMKLTRHGFLNWGFTSFMVLEIKNPNKIGLIAKDIVFSIYRVDDEEKTLIGDCTVNGTEVGPQNNVSIPAEIFLPIKSLFKGQRFFLPEIPDALIVIVRANVTVSGLDQTMWVAVSGYQDMHLFI